MGADAELNARLSAWASEAGEDLVADEAKVAMLFTSGKAATKKAVKARLCPRSRAVGCSPRSPRAARA